MNQYGYDNYDLSEYFDEGVVEKIKTAKTVKDVTKSPSVANGIERVLAKGDYNTITLDDLDKRADKDKDKPQKEDSEEIADSTTTSDTSNNTVEEYFAYGNGSDTIVYKTTNHTEFDYSGLYQESATNDEEDVPLDEWTAEEFYDESVTPEYESETELFLESKGAEADYAIYSTFKQHAPGFNGVVKYDGKSLDKAMGTNKFADLGERSVDIVQMKISDTVVTAAFNFWVSSAIGAIIGSAIGATIGVALDKKFYKDSIGRFPTDAKSFVQFCKDHNGKHYDAKQLKRLVSNIQKDAKYISNKFGSRMDLTREERRIFADMYESASDITQFSTKKIENKQDALRINERVEDLLKCLTKAGKVLEDKAKREKKKNPFNEYFS